MLEPETGKMLAELQGHQDEVSAVAFSPGGRRLASAGGDDGSIILWEILGKVPLLSIKRGTAYVMDVAFSPDGKCVVGAYGVTLNRLGEPVRRARPMEYPEEQVRLWDAKDGRLLRAFRAGGDRINAVSFTPDGTSIAVACENVAPGGNGGVVVLSLKTGEVVATVCDEWGISVGDVCVLGESVLATISYNARIRVWDITNSQAPRTVWERKWTWWDKIPRYPGRLPAVED